MKRKLIRTFAYGLTAVFCAMMTGCGGTSGYDPNNFLPEGTKENPYRIVKEPVTVKIFAPHSAGNPEYRDLVMFQYLSEITGLNFEFTTPDTSAYTNQRSSVWQTGSGIPDLFLFNNAVSEQVQYMENGYNAYAPFNDDSLTGAGGLQIGNIIDTYMPVYRKKLEENFGIDPEKENAVKTATLSDGKMYCTLSVKDVARDLTYKMFINDEWIENLNEGYDLHLPRADEIRTLEQYYTVLKAFKEYDANNNGDPDDEIPVTSKSLEYLRNFILESQGYVSYGIELESDGSQYTYVPYTEAYRNYLIFMNRLWKEGILDKNTFSITTDSQMAQSGTKNRLGSFVGAAAYLIVGYEYESQYTTFGPLTSDYYQGDPVHLGFGSFVPDGACIPMQSPYIREVARLLDIMYSDLGAQLISYGVEGQNWTWDDEEHTSWTFLVPEDWTGNQEQYRATITPNVGSASGLYYSNDFVGKMNDDILISLNKMSEMYLPYLKVPEPAEIKMNSEEYSSITTIKAALDPQFEYLEASYIRGSDGCDPSDDASYEAFLSKLKGYGADTLLKCYNDALARYKEQQI